MAAITQYLGTGRRKKSIARVRLLPGTGVITINGRDVDDYFGLETLKLIVNQPFGVTNTIGKFDIVASVKGGGFSGQAGAITINGRDVDDYFGLETLKLIVNQPFGVTETVGKFDIVANVRGGGISGQAGAIRHGVARALLTADENYKPLLKKAGLLTRDPRMKERKKYGLKAARRASQFSKR